MSRVVLGRWGKSLAVRLPSDVAAALSLSEGEKLDVEQHADSIVIRRSARPVTLEDLFAGKTPEEWRVLYRDHGVDWGSDVGREAIED